MAHSAVTGANDQIELTLKGSLESLVPNETISWKSCFHLLCLAIDHWTRPISNLRKYEATLGSIKLDTGSKEALHRYSKSVLSYVADFGTESLFSEDPWTHLEYLD